MLVKTILCVAVFQYVLHITIAFDPKAFDDSILYKLNWPGDVLAQPLDDPGIVVSTVNKENFRCILPEAEEKSNEDVEKYSGPNPLDLLQPLFKVTRCSYKLGSYWTYEICHGSHVRQYHEDREMKTPKGQEYSLGQWDADSVVKLREYLEEVDEKGEKKFLSRKLPVVKIENLKLPYLRINMTGGTFCDLSRKPRVTYVLYVCYKHGKHEVYSFKEISTCEYETVVLSPLLCSHPMFRPHVTNEKNINCYPMPGAAPKPRGLYELQHESAKLRQNRAAEESKQEKTVAVFSIKEQEDGRRKVHVEIIPVDSVETDETDKLRHFHQLNHMAMLPIEKFLSGRECLYGGSSWWKYEFCFGRFVRQYHEEKDGSRTTVLLGTFTEKAHQEWLETNPHKKSTQRYNRQMISYLYTNGDICDKTGLPRQTEVKLKCTQEWSRSVALSLTEPKTCEYILNVESSFLCGILPEADPLGRFPRDALKDVDLDVTIEVEDAFFPQSETATPDGAAGPPVSAFRSNTQDKTTERSVNEDSERVVFSSERKMAGRMVNLHQETPSEREASKSSSSQERGDTKSSSGSKPAASEPDPDPDQRQGRTSLKDEL